MKYKWGVICGVAGLASGTCAWAQLSASFANASNFGTTAPGNAILFGGNASFQLDINDVDTVIEFNVTDYHGSVTVVNTEGPGTKSFTVTVQTVQLILTGDGLDPDNPPTVTLGPFTGQALNVDQGDTSGPVLLGPATDFASAMLAFDPDDLPIKGNYQVTWWASAPSIVPLGGGKDGGVGDLNHYVSGTIAVPEPSEYALVAGLGLVGLALLRRRA